MKNHKRFLRSVAVFVLATVATSIAPISPAYAAEYPDRAIKMVVPATPGGAADIIARLVSAKLHEALGQTVIVENLGGASGIIGMVSAKQAPADGYTLLTSFAGAVAVNPTLRPDLPYDPVKDFKALNLVALSPLMIVASPSLPVRTVDDLIKLAKSKPGRLNYASTGTGSTQHLCMEMFKTVEDLDIAHIPYKGSAGAYVDMMSGSISVMCDNVVSMISLVNSGKLTPLAVTPEKRLASLPNVPTVAESGVPGFSANGWYGVFAPAGIPPDVAKRLNAEISKIIKNPEFVARLTELGLTPADESTSDFAAFIKADTAKWAKVIQDAHITLDK